jgi:hypothetical protein
MLNSESARGQVLFISSDYEDGVEKPGRSNSWRAWTKWNC